MKGRIEVAARVRHEVDPLDVELGALRVELPRSLATEVIADQGRRQTPMVIMPCTIVWLRSRVVISGERIHGFTDLAMRTTGKVNPPLMATS